MTLERKIINKEVDKKTESYLGSSMQYIRKAFSSVIPERKTAEPIAAQKSEINEQTRLVFSLFLPFLNHSLYLENTEWEILLDNVGGYPALRKVLLHLTENAAHIEEKDCEQYVSIAYFLHLNIVNTEINEIPTIKQLINTIISSMTFHCADLSAQNHLKMSELISCWGHKLPDKIPFGIFHAQYASKLANAEIEKMKEPEGKEVNLQIKVDSLIQIEKANLFIELALKEMDKLPPKIKQEKKNNLRI